MNQAQEYRVFGPPGTGKTTYLTKQIEAAGGKHGLDKIFVASFTRTAAKEISARARAALKIREGAAEPAFGTLHAHGYRSLGGRYQVAENKIKEWNSERPEYQLTGGKNADVDVVAGEHGGGTTAADELFDAMMMYRALMVPQERWRVAVRAFASKWESWKASNGLIDFSDMLEIPLRDVDAAPGAPSIGMLDEAQDASPLQMALFRKWGAAMDYIILAGDDDQCIFEWAGARPDAMTAGAFAEKRVLSQSYRVPRAVHALAQRTIAAVKSREPKEYSARDCDGEVRNLSSVNLRTPDLMLNDAEKYIAAGKSIMILASCSYMLDATIAELRRRGIPFHNPYRTKNGAWNPLHGSDARGVSSVDRLLSFADQAGHDYEADMRRKGGDAEPILEAAKMLQWYEILKSTGNIPRGQREALISRLEELALEKVDSEFVIWPDKTVSRLITGGIAFSEIFDFIDAGSALFQTFGAPDKLKESARWFVDNVAAAKAKSLAYPVEVLCAHGAEALRSEPRVIVGTIHSVKGGEADVVYVAPDVSFAGYSGMCARQEERDAAARLKYVAYTRARESVVLLGPFSNFIM